MRRFVVLALAAVVLAGCGSSGTIDRGMLQSEIHQWAVKQHLGSNAHARCPADVPIKAGSTFHCVLSMGSQTTLLTVTIENANGYVTWSMG